MKKSGILIAGGVAAGLAAGGYAGAAWWSGNEMEAGFRAHAEALSSDSALPLRVTVVSYERGLRGATAVTRVAPRQMPQVFLEFEHDITHGPDPSFGWGRIVTRLRGPEPLRAALDEVFGGQPAFTATSTLPFAGGSSIAIVSPAFDRGDAGSRASWGGLSGTVELPGEDVARFDLQAPSVAVQGRGGRFTATALRTTGEWKLSGPNSLHWTGRSTGSAESIEVGSPFGAYGVRRLSAEGWQKDQGDTLASGYLLTVGAATMPGKAGPETVFSDFALEVDAERLDRKALGDFMHASEAAQQPGLAPQEQGRRMLEAMAGLVEGLAAKSPRLNLKRLALESPRGGLRAEGHLAMTPAPAVSGAAADPGAGAPGVLLAVAERLAGRFVIDLSPDLVRFALEKRAAVTAYSELSRRGEPLDETAAAQLAARIAEDRLRLLVEAGLLRPEGERLRVEAVLAGGELTLNGLTREEFMMSVARLTGDRPVEQ